MQPGGESSQLIGAFPVKKPARDSISEYVALVFLLLLASLATAEERLHLKTRRVETIENLEDHLAGIPKRRVSSRSHLLVQFRQLPRPEQIEELKRRGLTVLRYVPDSGFLVAAEDDHPRLEGLALRWAGRLRFEDKLSPLLTDTIPIHAEPTTHNPHPTSHIPHPTTFLVEFHPDVAAEEAQALAREQLLEIREHPDLLPNQLLVAGALERVIRLAEWDEVAYIYPASEDLANGTRVQACAGAITSYGLVSQYVARISEGWDGPGQNAAALGYSFERLTPRVPEQSARSEILRALGEWARYVKLTFTPVADRAAPRSLNFLFASGAHGDGFPFDGPGKVLAHTFYPAPPNPEPIAGDLHFDDDEPWGVGVGIDLFSVALHEAGHALGLPHSDKPGAVMYPYYRRVSGLTEDDIAAIRELYAARTGDPPALPPAVPQAPANPPANPQPPAPKAPSPAPPPTRPDTVAPTLTILSPASTSVLTYAATISLRGTATDNVGVVEVTWSDSTGASGPTQGTSYWSTPDLPLREGTNTLTIRARDAAGNVGWRTVMVTRRKR